MNIVIVGSGPVGATYARLLLEGLPQARVRMIEVGPRLTDLPGMNVRNVADTASRDEARRKSQGPNSKGPLGLGIPGGAIVEGTLTARQGTHLIAHAGEGTGQVRGLPAAALATNVGGQGAHWTCATPRPADSEKIDAIPADEWDQAIGQAEKLLHTTKDAFADLPAAAAIRAALSEAFDADLPAGRGIRILPVAGDPQSDGTMRWSGTDVVLGPVNDPTSDVGSRFTLDARTLARRLLLADGDTVTGVEVEHLDTGESETIPADLVVVAADAIRTPQLLWASGIRPAALGHYLTEHPAVFGVVALNPDVVPPADDPATVPSDPIAAVTNVPFSDPNHPFNAQIMYMKDSPFRLPEDHPLAHNPAGYANLGWGCRKFPRYEDAVTFTDTRTDSWGMPGITIDYDLTEKENEEIQLALQWQARAAQALGPFVPGGEPRLMPAGASLHYQGTFRIGATDDGTSVCDSYSQPWNIRHLVLGGNGLIPAATAANPTLTSVALAVRGAHHIISSAVSPGADPASS